MRFYTTTLGCKANQYDTGTIEEIMRGRGHEQVKTAEGCDVCIINTCAVTAESVRKSRRAIRRVKKHEPKALVAVCGCYSHLERGALAGLGADIAGGTDDREGFVDEIENMYAKKTKTDVAKKIHHAPPPHPTPGSPCPQLPIPEPSPLSTSRTRALLKIQDGCDNRCAYCVIPLARGRSRSVPPGELAAKARALEEQGYKEIVVTGIEISSYEPDLIDALRAISAAAPGARLRLGSLNPDILTADFIKKLRKVPGICSHFHISLQSGCDETLAAMGRKYSTGEACKSISNLRGTFGNCGITADLIVGFPGETDAQFGQTLTFVEKADFSAMHIFPFSPRPGTKASDMPGQVGGSVKQQRARTAAAIAAKLRERFKRAQIGKTLDVLFEKTRPVKTGQKTKYSIGHSGNYLNVAAPCRDARYGNIGKNTLHDVKITSVKDGMLFGKIV